MEESASAKLIAEEETCACVCVCVWERERVLDTEALSALLEKISPELSFFTKNEKKIRRN